MRRSRAIVLIGLIGAAALGVMGVVFALSRGRSPAILGPTAVASLERVSLGGGAQWILIRGSDRSHPVILFLHGGPGMPAMFLEHGLVGRRMEDLAREIAECYGITEGLVCVLSVVEPCRTFSLVSKRSIALRTAGEAQVSPLFQYFLDKDQGAIHVKLQSWFPCQIQIYVNGHEWPARQLDRHHLKYMKLDNAIVRLLRFRAIADTGRRFRASGLWFIARPVCPARQSFASPEGFSTRCGTDLGHRPV